MAHGANVETVADSRQASGTRSMLVVCAAEARCPREPEMVGRPSLLPVTEIGKCDGLGYSPAAMRGPMFLIRKRAIKVVRKKRMADDRLGKGSSRNREY